jgi:glutathione peroxidase
MGFPCNQFGAQEPEDEAEILRFVTETYGVTFPMFAKIDVKGDTAAPLYRFLCSEMPHDDGSTDVKWNFEKFLVDRKGTVYRRYVTSVTPEQIAVDVAALRGSNG